MPFLLNDKRLHPWCKECGWRKGGVDSWNGFACKCGHSALPLRRIEEDDIERAPPDAELTTIAQARRNSDVC